MNHKAEIDVSSHDSKIMLDDDSWFERLKVVKQFDSFFQTRSFSQQNDWKHLETMRKILDFEIHSNVFFWHVSWLSIVTIVQQIFKCSCCISIDNTFDETFEIVIEQKQQKILSSFFVFRIFKFCARIDILKHMFSKIDQTFLRNVMFQRNESFNVKLESEL